MSWPDESPPPPANCVGSWFWYSGWYGYPPGDPRCWAVAGWPCPPANPNAGYPKAGYPKAGYPNERPFGFAFWGCALLTLSDNLASLLGSTFSESACECLHWPLRTIAATSSCGLSCFFAGEVRLLFAVLPWLCQQFRYIKACYFSRSTKARIQTWPGVEEIAYSLLVTFLILFRLHNECNRSLKGEAANEGTFCKRIRTIRFHLLIWKHIRFLQTSLTLLASSVTGIEPFSFNSMERIAPSICSPTIFCSCFSCCIGFSSESNFFIASMTWNNC